jgi:hypothetical protein
VRAILSILGLYQYNPDIFNLFKLPDGVSLDTVRDNILMELAELELLYPSGTFMKTAIGIWSTKQLPVWEKLYATTNLEYNPIHNYDRTEEWTEKETGNRNESRTQSQESSGESSGTVQNSGEDTVKSDVSAFNETSYTPKELQTTTLGTENTSRGTAKQTTDITDDTDENSIRNNSRTGRAFGNIGVTTTQQMIEAERNVVKFNIVDYIVEDFKKRFCLLIY